MSAMKTVLLKIWRILRNYYVLATLVFVVWVGFIDTDNFISQRKQRKEVDDLLAKKKFYTEEIQKMKKLSNDLATNKEAMERYGRETYLMKKPNEDIFLVVNEPSKGK